MALKEKIEQSELILYEILRNPVLCNEFIINLDKTSFQEPFRYTWYQREFLGDFGSNVSFCCARSVGKTESITGIIIWIMINNIFKGDYILYTVPAKVHLEPVWNRLITYFRSNSFLKNFHDGKTGFNSSDFTIRLQNHSQLICRIAGQTGTGANVVGLHTPFGMLDESAFYPYGTWIELQPTLNTFTDGFRLMVSGVPDGRRERSVCYECDALKSEFTKHRISALQNPRFSEEDLERAKEQYGGEDSDDYIHMVLGQHGKPVFSLFDRANFEIGNYPVYKLILNGQEMHDNLVDYVNKVSIFPGLPDKSHRCIMGVDLGYTEPTAIVILYIDNFGRIKFHGRIRLDKVSYTIQDRFIDLLDSKFNPILIGIDEGGVGKPVVQRLLEAHDFLHKDYHKKLVPINFSQSVVLGIDSSGEEIKSKTKPLAVSVLQEYSNNHKYIYTSTDLEMITELERMTFSKSITGEIIYKTLTEKGGKKGEDHFTAALLCATLAYYLKNESLDFTKARKKLAKSSWFIGNNL